MTALIVRARILMAAGDRQSAAEDIQAAAKLARALNDADGTQSSRWLQGALALTQGDLDAAAGQADLARSHWRRAVAILEAAAKSTKDPQVLATLAEALHRIGDTGAEKALREDLAQAGFGGTRLFTPPPTEMKNVAAER